MCCDIETYSDVDLKKAGLYKYAESPAFSVLLFAYSFDGGPVHVIDLACGDAIPEDVVNALYCPEVIKHAYNAAFEIECLSRHFGRQLPVYQWRCTMLHGLYVGYPGSLDATGKALGLEEDKRKMAAGKALIRYFCTPCKPTKANGGRTRNLPHHDPGRWDLFKQYNAQDVVTEMEIERRLSAFPVPAKVQTQWELDLEINRRGVAVDMDLVHGALELDATGRAEMIDEAREITGLDNPNSVGQLAGWLRDRTGEEIPKLTKEAVSDLLGGAGLPGDARRVLEIRQELGKTSNKKYNSLEAAVCGDGRVRGLLQFYGANRTGRWCLTGDHEILTPKGWERLDEWEGGEIACWAPSTETISFQKAEALRFYYSGEMYRVRHQRCEQICTPDHKMAVLGKTGNWEAYTMDALGMHRFTIPFTGKRAAGQNAGSGIQLRVLVMVQADGHYTESGDIRLKFKKGRKTERCKMLLRAADIPFIHTENGDGSHSFCIKSRWLPLWLRQFKDKTFGWWLIDESPDVIFDELPYWDGYRCGPNSIQYCTTNKQNADVIQACAALSGLSATIITKRRDERGWSSAYYVNVWLTPGRGTAIRREQVSKECFSGDVYCAATKTGFFVVRRNGKVWITGNSGKLVQPQNLPRTYIDGDLLPLARDLVKRQDAQGLRLVYGGSVADTLSQLIRTAFCASPGALLVDADFSAIEARMIAWLAGEEWVLEVFRTHGKIYEAAAAQMFGVPFEDIRKGRPEYAYRQKGKVATLALGYQGGTGALINMGALRMGIPEDDLPDIVDRWRQANRRIVEFWWALDAASKHTVQTGRPVELPGGKVAFAREIDRGNGLDFLTIRLPSGRKLHYAQPRMGQDRFGRPSICYMGLNQTTKKWETLETYGGKLAENITQAVARDCLAEAITRLEAAGYRVVFHVHDEVVTDRPGGTEADLDRVAEIMSVVPDWAPGLPLAADGWVNAFFKKD